MKPIAATRIFDELPPLGDVLTRRVTVLGSTGSIGVNTLDVIAHVRKVHGADAMPMVDSTPPAQLPEDQESLRQLREALLHLRPEEKEVFLLRQNGAAVLPL